METRERLESNRFRRYRVAAEPHVSIWCGFVEM